jgi:hypothetical protein
MTWAQNDQLFFKELKEGHAWQHLPAMFFSLCGLTVEIPELSVRGSIKDAGKWLNTVDLVVNGLDLEIKSRNERFTSCFDFPYPTAFVDTKNGFDAKEKKPFAYVMISRPTGGMVWTPSNPDSWSVEQRWDRVRRIRENFYLVNKKDLLSMDTLIMELKRDRA